MKNLLALTILLSTLISGCSGGGGGRKPGVVRDLGQFSGLFRSTCDSGDIQEIKVIDAENTIITYEEYNDNECTELGFIRATTVKTKYAIDSAFINVSVAKTIVSEKVIIYDGFFSSALNDDSYCGITTWNSVDGVDVTGKDCGTPALFFPVFATKDDVQTDTWSRDGNEFQVISNELWAEKYSKQ